MTLDEKYKEYRATIAKTVTGKIVACHDDEGHKYKFVDSGKIVRSVTTKLIIDRPHLIPWAVKVAFEYMENQWQNITPDNRDQYLTNAQQAPVTIRDDAGDIGHKAHAIIEDYSESFIKRLSSGMPMFYPPPIQSFIPSGTDTRIHALVRSAQHAFCNLKAVPVASELLVGIDGMSAGTLDMLVMNDQGELEIWDWKTSNHVHETYAYQVAAYARFFTEMTGLPIVRTRIIHLSKEFANPIVHNIDNIDKAWETFVHLNATYDLVNENKFLTKNIKSITIDPYDPTN